MDISSIDNLAEETHTTGGKPAMTLDQEQAVAVAFYQTARDEMLLRIRERELATYVWLFSLGTLLTLSFGSNPPRHDLLLTLPVLALGIVFRISQHEMLIGTLAGYCKNEVGPIVKNGCNPDLRHWDESDALGHYQRNVVNFRTVINVILIVGPAVTALVLNYESLSTGSLFFRFAWSAGLVFTLASLAFLIQSFLIRLAAAYRLINDTH